MSALPPNCIQSSPPHWPAQASKLHAPFLFFRGEVKSQISLYSLFFDPSFALAVVVIVLLLFSRAAGCVSSVAVTVQMETNRTREGFGIRAAHVALGQSGITYFNAPAELRGNSVTAESVLRTWRTDGGH